MKKTSIEKFCSELLASVGIEINGQHPWDMQIHNTSCFDRIVKEGSLGLGESYMDTWWDCQSLDQFFERILKAHLEDKIKNHIYFRLLVRLLFHKIINVQTKKRSLLVGRTHYDLGNNLYQAMLDSRMNYTCGYWQRATNLEEAQRDKLELTCQKLKLEPGMRLLDIGCGFGSFAKYAAVNFGVKVVGITISKEQCDYAKQNCSGLPIEIRFQDYRDINEKFDRIVSLGMFEHVGYLNYPRYMQIVHRNLNEQGLFLLHTIGSNKSRVNCNEWVSKYIFPNSMLPSISQIGKAVENLFVMEDWQNSGVDYNKTLLAWYNNFLQNWDELKKDYDQRFYRMWNYYLLSSAGSFRARQVQLWQIVFCKNGLPGVYQRPILE